MPGLSGKARGLDMILDPLVGVNKGRSILNIKSRCVTYVSAVTFNWLSKRSNCNHVSCNMTNINKRDGSEDLRAVWKRSAAVSETTRNWKKIGEGQNYGKMISNTDQNAKN